MNYRLLALASLGLWLVTAAVLVTLFVRGQTAPSSDGRRAIMLAPAERDLVLAEMRNMLGSVQGILHAVNADDMPKVITYARASGMQAAADINPGLMAKLPLEFKQLGLGVHNGFDNLALIIEQNQADREEIMQRLAVQLDSCVQCHASYRIEVAATEQP
ncbi:MAG: hypothetical protein QG652_160 [Pseudomonadota bacterium]|nr:hypothetical protein [Pseudomonadota bacterium]